MDLKRRQSVEHSETYYLMVDLIENNLIIFERQEFIERLSGLQSNWQITEEEVASLLQLADERNVYDLHVSRQLITADDLAL